MTERLYYEDAHMRTFTARVASCVPGKHGFDVDVYKRQIENKAIRKLRHPSRAKKIKDFYC